MKVFSRIAAGISAGAGMAADLLAKQSIEEEKQRLELEKLMRIDEMQAARDERKRQADYQMEIQKLDPTSEYGKAKMASMEEIARVTNSLKEKYFEADLSRAEKTARMGKEIELSFAGDPRAIKAAKEMAEATETQATKDQKAAQAKAAVISAGASATQAAASLLTAKEQAKQMGLATQEKQMLIDARKTFLDENASVEQQAKAARNIKILSGKFGEIPEAITKQIDIAVKAGDALAKAGDAEAAKAMYNKAYALTSGSGEKYPVEANGKVIGMASNDAEAEAIRNKYRESLVSGKKAGDKTKPKLSEADAIREELAKAEQQASFLSVFSKASTEGMSESIGNLPMLGDISGMTRLDQLRKRLAQLEAEGK